MSEIDLAVKKLAEYTTPAPWMKEMEEYYRQNGTFRQEDIRRLLGEPSKGVAISADKSLEAFFTS